MAGSLENLFTSRNVQHSDAVVHGVVSLSVHLVLIVFILLIASLLLVGGHSLLLGWMLWSTAKCLGLDLRRDMWAP